ncbi:MAG: sugar transferase [Ignavibacteria bacterium CG_4_8_14_3_um_filter_37_9]|nr:sugar transferase [Ignavibacteria bacterium]OIO23309.1 MAG: sugar transferase [Ignavibacteria bacterium CG1_02_37_35]PIW99576.1 MAG: sugar transferase [Ignavibacteria bacterium CG_4_8_14_3_um_filter_37_9]PIX95488.1 MAG: sugar transferase [Ignavibacteria bacterium CG_4_10_14_3_um_filter_37_18]PJC59164.1 MAG: sugar transferase [Ignavibacteria bacterium CG_4_9_14_0_2_um_filter_37_13]
MGREGSFIKRFSDIIIGFCILILHSPILLIAMAAIKIESPGPAIFIQLRAGKGGKPFKMFKLRGMVKNALEIGPNLTQINDPRLTKTGRFFRRLSIDELPQFFNVLNGTMSIVGPRPEILDITESYTDEQKKVFQFTPGITGFSQINGRQMLTPEERTRMEVEYYRKATFISDLLILLKTPFVILSNEGNI